jgi:hypothetical protein
MEREVSTMSSEHQRPFLEEFLEAGRSERAPDDLGEFVIERVEHRARLEQYGPSDQKWRPIALAGLGGAFVLAAALALLVRREPSPAPISVEPAPRAAAPTSAPSVVDPCAAPRRAPGLEPLIDDFEDGDDAVAALEQRVGFWRWVREIDAPGTAPALIPIPRPEATAQNRLALHAKGGRLLDWGAVIETTFRPACYDASEYAGIAFQARGPGRLYFGPREVSVIPLAEGGTCREDCHNPHVVKIDLDGTFKRYEVRWAELRQRGMNQPALDPSQLNSLAFLVRPEDTPYDVWIDDLRFIRR